MNRIRSLAAWALAAAMVWALGGLSPASAVTAHGGRGEGLIAVGVSHTAAVKTDGTLWMWGRSQFGQIGPERYYDLPVQVMEGVSFVAAGDNHTFAIKTDRTLWGWGYNQNGELGDGSRTNRTEPVKLMDGIARITAAPDGTALAVGTDGTLWVWGNGQIAPQRLLGGIASVYAGPGHYAAIDTGGGLWLWGRGESGQLGSGARPARAETPVRVLDDVTGAALSEGVTFAVRADGGLWAWGSNEYGELSVPPFGPGSFVTEPTRVMGSVESVSADRGAALAVKWDGTLWVFGINAYMALGVGDDDNRPVPVRLLGGIDGAVTAHSRSMAVGTDGTLYGWGDNTDGKVGAGHAVKDAAVAAPAVLLEGISHAAVSETRAVAVGRDGGVWSWGGNEWGEVGDGSHYDRSWPVKVLDGAALPAARETVVARPNSSTVLVDGAEVSFDAYTINQNNYFKLRDLAYILNGTEAQFNVTWNPASGGIALTGGAAYAAVGGEMADRGTEEKTPVRSAAEVTWNNQPVTLTAYTIDQNNYVKLRDLAALLDFGVVWVQESGTILIQTNSSYTP